MKGQRTTNSLLFGQAPVDPRDLIDEAVPVRVLQVEDLVHGPVKVVGDVRDLLEEAVGRVRQDSPGEAPPISTLNSWRQAGHVTEARDVPSWFTRR